MRLLPLTGARPLVTPATAVDVFKFARLEKEGPSPAPEADWGTRIRRATFDLIGLPPTARETELAVEFLATRPLRDFALAAFNLNAFLYVN